MQDLVHSSGAGYTLFLTASNTFPNGITITMFGSDNDPFEIGEKQIADGSVDVNGNGYINATSNLTPFGFYVAQNTPEGDALDLLFKKNTPGQNIANDVITITGKTGTGKSVTFSKGFCVSHTPGTPMGSDGKLKDKKYNFSFLNTN